MDPKEELEEQFTKNECKKWTTLLEECTKRVESNPETTEICQQEVFDLAKCVDKHVTVY